MSIVLTDTLSIQRPDYAYYAKLSRIRYEPALFLLAKMQLTDEDYTDPDRYNKKFSEKLRIACRILKDAVMLDEMDCDPALYENEEGETEIFEDETYFYMPELCEWALSKRISLPDELMELVTPETQKVTEQQKPERALRPVQLAKIKCQAIAQTLWSLNPKMTITEMTKHPAILEFGEGKDYAGKDTLPGWLREVDPRSDSEKTGPRKTKSGDCTK